MRLLVVGGTGVLSTAVVREAQSREIEVAVINRGSRPDRIPQGVELIKSDVRDRSRLQTLLEGRQFDAVVDFICYTEEQIAYSIGLFKDVARQYIFISTACVYDTRLPGKKKEDAPKVLDTWDYSRNKWACEEYLQGFAGKNNINYTIIRPCVTYDDTRIPYGIMPSYGYHWTLIGRILAGKPVITWDNGEARWNLMRVEDFAKGFVGLVGNEKAYGKAVNLCGDVAYSWKDVLECMGHLLGKEVKTVDVSSSVLRDEWQGRSGEISGRALDAMIDNTLLKSLVQDYQERMTLEEGLCKTIEAYKSQNYQKGIDWSFDAECDRLVAKYGGRKDKHRFTDYIGTASLKDKAMYLIKKNRDCFIIRVLQSHLITGKR